MTDDQARQLYMLEGKVEGLASTAVDHEQRLRAMESQIYKWLGATAVLSTALALVVHFIFHI